MENLNDYKANVFYWISKMHFFKSELKFYEKIVHYFDSKSAGEYSDRKLEYLDEIMRGLTTEIENAIKDIKQFENFIAIESSDKLSVRYKHTQNLVNNLMNELNNFKVQVFKFSEQGNYF